MQAFLSQLCILVRTALVAQVLNRIPDPNGLQKEAGVLWTPMKKGPTSILMSP